MIYLLIVSLVWAFSFGLIKGQLTGIDSNLVAFLRLLISFVVFLPLIRLRNLNNRNILKLALIGAIQYGIMYSTYIYSYQFLKAYEVALFTIFTPLYISIISNILNKKFDFKLIGISFLAVIGAGVITYKGISDTNLLKGFLIIQISNLCFAFGQIYYKKIMQNIEVADKNIFGILYLGAIIVTGTFTTATVDFSNLIITGEQISVLLYLGIVASGLCFFWWNLGARKTDNGTLSIFNNAKIPLGILVSLIIFGESANYTSLAIGSSIIVLSFYLNSKFLTRKDYSK